MINKKQIVCALCVGLTLFMTCSAVLAATYDELMAQAADFDQQAVGYRIVAARAKATEGEDSAAYTSAISQAKTLEARAANARAEAALIGPGGSQEPLNPQAQQPGYQPPQNSDAQPQAPAANFKLIVPIPGISPTETDPLQYIKGIYNFGIGFGMLIAMAIIIYAGLKWTTSAGNISAQSEAKDMILNAVLGVAMLLGAVLILRTIDPKLTTLRLPELKSIGKQEFDFAKNAAEFNQLIDKWKTDQSAYAAAKDKVAALEKRAADEKAATGKVSLETQIALKQAEIEKQTALLRRSQDDYNISVNQLNNDLKKLNDQVGVDLGQITSDPVGYLESLGPIDYAKIIYALGKDAIHPIDAFTAVWNQYQNVEAADTAAEIDYQQKVRVNQDQLTKLNSELQALEQQSKPQP